jgi:glycogen debranching enzyme
VWDGPLSRVDTSAAPAFERRDTEVAGDASVRPTDEHYRGYAALVQAIADDGFGEGPFAVYDPMMSAVLARAEDDLQWLCEQCAVPSNAAERGAALRRALCERLFDDTRGRFRYVDARAELDIDVDVIGGYLPLWCGLPPAIAGALRRGLQERFAARWPLPSTSPLDPAFEARRYWRGPSWINTNWMLADALRSATPDSGAMGADLRQRTLTLLEQRGFHEYYDPNSGEGLGGEHFTWSAALALDLLRR